MKETSLFGIMGNPVNHSFSPKIHSYIASKINENIHYNKFLVENDNLREAINGAFALGIKGLNITSPHKENVIKYIYKVDKLAEIIGAVNTLKYTTDGYIGYNTDILGVEYTFNLNHISIRDKNVVIFGSGGSAKSICVYCAMNNVKTIFIINRTLENALKLKNDIKKHFSVNIEIVDKYNLPNCDIAINTTTLGFAEQNNLCPIDNSSFFTDKNISVAIDLIYNPNITNFLKFAKSAGIKYINGQQMLIYQGISSDEIWFDIKFFPKQKLYFYKYLCNLQNDVLCTEKNIVLIGFMGTGKTLFGKKLAKKLNRRYYNIDTIIERNAKMSINNLFETYGEDYFRQLERSICKTLSNKNFSIISTGGGVIKNPLNIVDFKKNSIIIYLNSSLQRIKKNLSKSNNRPLLKDKNITDLISERHDLYKKYADIEINLNNFNINENVNLILEAIYEKNTYN